MKKKGFTLIELLAVIVILAVIALISMPLVLNTINKAKEGSNKNSVYGIVEAAELYASGQLIKNNSFDTDTNILPELSYKGNKPEDYSYYGYGVYINKEGKVGVAVIYDNKCYLKDYNETEVKIENYSNSNCNLSNLEVWDGSIEEPTLEDNTYNIYNAKQLAWIQKESENGNTFAGKTIVLKNDINLGGVFDQEGNTLKGSKSFAPIGDWTNKFSGIIDGEGHTIYNLYIKQEGQYAGLIGDSLDVTIKNLTIKNSYIEGNNATGIIGAIRTNIYSEINNVKSVNNIINSTGGWTGGIVGQATTEKETNGKLIISNCYSSSNVSGSLHIIGGISGRIANYGDSIVVSNNQNIGKVNSNYEKYSYIGGIVGYVYNVGNNNITLSDNKNTGKIIGNSYSVGGIVGILDNEGKSLTIDNNINEGYVQGETKWIGGIVGILNDVSKDPFYIISNNVNKGTVTTKNGAFRVGGIIGNGNYGRFIYNNVNYGKVDGYGNGTSMSFGVGGIVGSISYLDDGTVVNASKLISNANYGEVKGNYSAGGIIGNLYQGTASGDHVLYSYNEGSVEAVSGYAGGIIGKLGDGDQLIDTEYVSYFVNNAYNKGEVKGLNSAGLSGANVGIKNAITLGNISGTNKDGVIMHTLDGVILDNVYYPNIYTSKYGVSFDKNALTKDSIKGILGDTYWNYDTDTPRLYKVNVSVSDNNISSIDVTGEILN